MTKKWKNVYIDSTFVSQEGTETLYTMFRQRERWAWGTLQTLKWFVFRPSFWRKKFSLRTKLDISVYLIHVLLPVLVFLCWIWSGLAILGIIGVSNWFPFAFMLANGFSFIPLFGYIGLCVIILITRILTIILSLIWIRRNKIKLNLLKFNTSELP